MPEPRVPLRHPSEERLLDYASGAAKEPVALLVATHLALCPACRWRIAELEAVGGALLEAAPPDAVAEDSLARVMARLERPEPEPEATAAEPGDLMLPQPLRDYVGGSLDRLTWRRLGPVNEARLLTELSPFTTRLLAVKPGVSIPSHTHAGHELTLVLQGGFSDRTGHYLRGDVAEADGDLDHSPRADDDEPCLCLSVTDAPLRLTSRLGRMLNPFRRI